MSSSHWDDLLQLQPDRKPGSERDEVSLYKASGITSG